MRALAPGTVVGPYVVEAELARGGMGAVYRARRGVDGAVVALKVLPGVGPSSAERLLRFQREAEVAARLRHPAIVGIHDAGVAGGTPYIAMDLIDGEALGKLAGRIAPLDAARLLAQVARAVEHAHAHGVVHRDLKPDNVLVRRDDGRPVVTDFGLARDLDGTDALTRTGALMGTPHYMAPEQASGQKADEKSDVYGVGATLHEAITGVPPFQAQDLGTLLAKIAGSAPERPSALAHGVPCALDEVVARALAKDPADRPTAGALAEALEAIAEGRAPDGLPQRRLARPLAALGVTLALGVVGVGVIMSARSPVDAPAPGPSTPTPGRAVTLPEPPWSEPDWVRALARGDEAALLAAHAEFDARPAVDPRARAAAVEHLRALDARWAAPPANPARADALDLLLWLHWLWCRLDPDHRPGRAGEVLTENDPWRPERVLDAPYMLLVSRATVAVRPDDFDAYLLYVHHAEQEKLPRAAWDADLLRLGVERTRAAGAAGVADVDDAWGMLLEALVRHLEALPVSREVRAELAALARAAAADGARAPRHAAMTIAIAGERAVDEGALSLDEAAQLAGAGLELLAAARFSAPGEIARLARVGHALHLRAGRPTEAQATIERGLAASSDHPQVGLALTQLIIYLDRPHHRDAILTVAHDLAARIDRLMDRGKVRGSARLLTLQDALRRGESTDALRAAVAEWRDPDTLTDLDPR